MIIQRCSRRLGVILVGAAVIRVSLALRGGQFYFNDESRFLRGVLLDRSLAEGNWHLVAQTVAIPQHSGFTFLCAIVAFFAHGLAFVTGNGDWSQAVNVREAAPLIAVVLSTFSVLNVWLIHRIARTAGAPESEADLAALLAAVATSLCYYSRHLLPYDSSLSAALIGLLLAITAVRPGRQIAAGAGAGACFALYNGYWFLAPAILLALGWRQENWPERTRGIGFGFLGCVLATIIAILPGLFAEGSAYVHGLLTFSGSVNQGIFAEGWSVPWQYLWQTEGIFGLIVLGAAALLFIARRGGERVPDRAYLWLGIIVLLYGLLTLTSNGLDKFVVYGRTARPLTVFFCLLGGCAVNQLLPRIPRWRPAALASLLVLAGINLFPHYKIAFPRETTLSVWNEFGVPKLAVTFSGVYFDSKWPAVTRPDLALVNPVVLSPVRKHLVPPPGRIIAQWRHPQSLPAYLFEGYTPRERRLLVANPPAIFLVELATPEAVPDQPPSELQARQNDLADGYDHGKK